MILNGTNGHVITNGRLRLTEADRFHASLGGPKTNEGKRRASRNATKHGFTSEAPVIEGESEAGWEEFRDGILTDLRPFGPVEQELAARIASLMWRLRRVTRYEVAAIACNRTVMEKAVLINENFYGPTDDELMATACLPTSRNLAKVQRYETHLDRCRSRTLGDLLELQRRRAT